MRAHLNRIEHQSASMLNKISVYLGSQARIRDVDYAKSMSEQSSAQIRLMSTPLLNQISQMNALRVLDLISQPALSKR